MSEQGNNRPCGKTSLCRSRPGLELWTISKGDDGGLESGRSWRTSESSGCLRTAVDDDQWFRSLLDLSPFFSSVGSELGRLCEVTGCSYAVRRHLGQESKPVRTSTTTATMAMEIIQGSVTGCDFGSPSPPLSFCWGLGTIAAVVRGLMDFGWKMGYAQNTEKF